MPSGFLSLPSELRNRIYELVLCDQDCISPRYGGERNVPEVEILYTNKLIYQEASFLLYGHNQFNFAEVDTSTLGDFIDQIGSKNVGIIRHLMIEFPRVDTDDPRGEVPRGDFAALHENTATTLAAIQSRCTALRTITMFFEAFRIPYLIPESLDSELATRWLEIVESQFKAIPSSPEIIVQFHARARLHSIRKRMESLGWTIRTSGHLNSEKRTDEDDWASDDDGFYDTDFYDDSNDGVVPDGYDIDHGSDSGEEQQTN
ncbi:unnamed protein product [Parascedosporium putredinis]|uniref:Uncharacterized protein n=1 Tax=Parascedosporium putredinis TaxID=1442378 RepID=A0A9P1GZH5_9PEZI|nr:unnamed protein product [Parascedosporium putredinis]CAI7991814.1 unnamed protein product [Parascedosporium putredinis]